MLVKEKSNLLVIFLENGEDIDQQIQNIIREYKLIDAKITGYGYLKRLEYGVLSQIDPFFLSKLLKEGLITVTNLNGMVDNRESAIMVSSVDDKFERHQGRLISGVVANSFNIILEIYKTE
ncbi:PCC domain-containing protein [Spiroplasma endosymbiont of Dioctria linearis]|uniref:PCC domain-containing protein n=1 Tax=Spiroplasma endosymbiont of Dioctria linearis TaxID=3066290 RepID=UPI00313B2DC7